MSYRNPVIPGFYSDPSICRVGEDFYLAMYATGNGKRSEASAAFDWFDYAVTE